VVRGKGFGRESRSVEFCLCLTKGSQERVRCRIKVICGGELSETTSQMPHCQFSTSCGC
jgi:hypothetical protein